MSIYKFGRNIPEFVRRFREESDLSQLDLGNQLGVHAQYVSNVERGVHKNPVQFCAQLLGVVDKKRAGYLIQLIDEASSDRIYQRLNLKKATRISKRKASGNKINRK